MKVCQHANARDFLAASQSWLLKDEPANNLMLGIARRSAEGLLGDDSKAYWASVHDGSEIVGTAFRTPPYHLAVSEMPLDAIPLLARAVRHVYPDLSGVSGPAAVTEPFARHWTNQHGGTWRIKFRQRIHALRSVETIEKPASGALRQMNESDEQLIREWMNGFARDTGTTVLSESLLQPLLVQRAFHLWEDDGARSVVGRGRDTPNGACITAVYTPPSYRRKGYATVAVAALSKLILSSGRTFCCLYTDLDNPTSNSIYRKIGYSPVRDDMELFFEDDRPAVPVDL